MVAHSFAIDATVRHGTGKNVNRRLRLADKVPGVVYGGGKEPMSITFDHRKLLLFLEQEAVYSHLLTLRIDTAVERVILKALQRHPYKRRIMHIDLQRVTAHEKITMHVPLHFINGEGCPGVKAGGVISHIVSDVEISCLPDHLPESIAVDLKGMELNDILHLSNLILPEHVELVGLLHHHDQPVVSVHLAREESASAASDEVTTPSAVPATQQKGDKTTSGDK